MQGLWWSPQLGGGRLTFDGRLSFAEDQPSCILPWRYGALSSGGARRRPGGTEAWRHGGMELWRCAVGGTTWRHGSMEVWRLATGVTNVEALSRLVM